MNEIKEDKYVIGEQQFSIHHIYRTGFTVMPRPHVHDNYELYFLLQGERIYFMNGKVYTARKGDLIFILPHDLHSTASTQLEETERILIHFSPTFLPQQDHDILDLPPYQQSALLRLPAREQVEVERLFLQMNTECRNKQPLHDRCVQHLLLEMLILVHRSEAAERSELVSSHPMHQKITEISSFIQDHFNEPLTLEQVAACFFISPAYLSRIFLKLTGFHFSEYIRVVRVRAAQTRLRTTKDKIQHIAEDVGFGHASHFNKIFKKITGLSPLQYRKQVR
ncbi:AraC-like DNA-binding protein/mannose-6-phosphate isomerase-like protein (cupin superfamily) [Paenibacillus jamilae]|uniref:helix-turn-helix transcriptional regulator n=1 Tax=Paenibacillus TaxID=44249 RepID=UPI0002D4F5C0|nr:MULTISPECIES: AraC family transcriptional regulator [Paenibacillus]MDP9678266.1 AraC-like DNA-binding protein/mannose-6-phosphate isomerase-like protein (cupin superfamily) [Paenibacillus jamilae]AHM68034.1 transcriptional regulator [Paenibacillus polymyxa SQR-21]AIY08739.1 AraC family transcriptional regulator [Paenibacillus polymyxa]KKD56730.1 AraC family transcriptional regulator [Paenibacillus sp. ICGEB2008]MEE4580280.1 AraC family transcriptional regulator [Paenibacillus polymyxa]